MEIPSQHYACKHLGQQPFSHLGNDNCILGSVLLVPCLFSYDRQCKRNKCSEILWDVKEPTHLSLRVGHVVPGVVVCLLLCIMVGRVKKGPQ